VTSQAVNEFPGEHFLDAVSNFPAATGKANVIGVYIAWRGRDLTFPGFNLLTFYSRKAVASHIASQVSCLATLDELALAAGDPNKKFHRCVLIGHSFGGLLLGNPFFSTHGGSFGSAV
jgi:hypothetical protein